MKTITVEIDPQGNITIEDEHGGAQDVVAELEKALFTNSTKKRTCSAKSEKSQQKQVQRG